MGIVGTDIGVDVGTEARDQVVDEGERMETLEADVGELEAIVGLIFLSNTREYSRAAQRNCMRSQISTYVCQR